MRDYAYRCHDFSLLTPTFKKLFVAPLLTYVPWVIPANIITIFSNLFVYLGLYIAMYHDSTSSRLAIALCLFLYLIGDHLDGMQAKRTSTGSALGEFCDHYLDAFNNGIIAITACLVFDVSNPLLVTTLLTASYLAHMVVFYEQFKTGWLTFEKLGSLEAVLIISILVGASAIPQVFDFVTATSIYGLRMIEIIFVGSALGAIVTFITTLKRTPNRGIEVWLFTAGLVAFAVMMSQWYTAFEVFVLITLYASLYVGLVMRGHLVDGIERMPDLVAPASLLVVYFFNPEAVDTIFWLLTIYLSVRIGILVIQTFSVLKIFWVWSNPRI